MFPLVLFIEHPASAAKPSPNEALTYRGLIVSGLAVSWDNRDTYYISLSDYSPPDTGDHFPGPMSYPIL